jgi:putative SOS response-associated peptidase YedK
LYFASPFFKHSALTQFCNCCLCSNYDSQQPIRTYTIITTEANPLMAEIHNTKKRMPVIVQNQYDWLLGDNLIAQKVFDQPATGSLF